MPQLRLTVLSLRYSSWSMRAWLVLKHAGARFETETIELAHLQTLADADSGPGNPVDVDPTPMEDRRALGSVHGLFPVLRIDNTPIHESFAICESVAEMFPDAGLWPEDSVSRARARAISCEMVGGFQSMRNEMSCHLFGRVPDFSPSMGAVSNVSRVFEIWHECLDRSGGPFLFGRFSIADAMYFPVLSRFRTYGIPIAKTFAGYERAVDTLPAVLSLLELASTEPRIEIYDDYLLGLGGNPDGALPAR